MDYKIFGWESFFENLVHIFVIYWNDMFVFLLVFYIKASYGLIFWKNFKELFFIVYTLICSGSTTPSYVLTNYPINGVLSSTQTTLDVCACENLCSSDAVIFTSFNIGDSFPEVLQLGYSFSWLYCKKNVFKFSLKIWL